VAPTLPTDAINDHSGSAPGVPLGDPVAMYELPWYVTTSFAA
jgi:hypothetical protein